MSTEPKADRWFKVATVASLVAALALVAQSEWALALAVGWPAWIAWAAPLALDAYVLAAVRVRRDLGPSVVVSALSVLGSHAVHAAPGVWTSGTVGTGHLRWELAAACSVVPLLVTWRVHHLHAPATASVEAATLNTEAAYSRLPVETTPTPLPVAAPESKPEPLAPPAEAPAARTAGRSARDLVHAAHRKDPARTQADVARDLGLSTKTVGRHWPKPHLAAVRDVAEA